MKLFLTSGVNPLGLRLLRKFQKRGDDVCALASSAKEIALIEQLGGHAILGDILHPETFRLGMRGADIVCHNAELFDPTGAHWRKMELINVSGTRNLLQAAQDLKIPKTIVVSHAAIYGDTGEECADEATHTLSPELSHYHRTKWKAYHEVIIPFIEAGLPVMVAIPSFMYGFESRSYIDFLMQDFAMSRFPFRVLFGPRTLLSVVHIDDVADGIVLMAEKGRSGESYILGGPPVTLGELADFWSRITGKRENIYQIPSRIIKSIRPLLYATGESLPLSPAIVPEMTGILGTSSIVSSDKAMAELGWAPQSIQKRMLDTFEEMTKHSMIHQRADYTSGKVTNRVVRLLLASALVLFAVWLVWGRKSDDN